MTWRASASSRAITHAHRAGRRRVLWRMAAAATAIAAAVHAHFATVRAVLQQIRALVPAERFYK